jgi:hypothetical protein
MVESAERNPRVEVFKRPKDLSIQEEDGWGDAITGKYQGVEVGVLFDSQVVWSKAVYPIFIGLRTGFLIDVPRPFFAQRIEGAEKKARTIASKL